MSRHLPREVIARSASSADLLAAAFGRVGARDEAGRMVASLPDLYAAIAQSATDAPTHLDFAEMLLRLLIDTPVVTEMADGRFAYSPNIAKGVSSQDPTAANATVGACGVGSRASIRPTGRVRWSAPSVG